MTTLLLGPDPGELALRLLRDADFDATLTLTDADGADLDFPDGDVVHLVIEAHDYPATMEGANATWHLDKADVNDLLDERVAAARVELRSGTATVPWFTGMVNLYSGGHVELDGLHVTRPDGTTVRVIAAPFPPGPGGGVDEAAVLEILEEQKNIANGIAGLTAGGRVPGNLLGTGAGVEGTVLAFQGGNIKWLSTAASGSGGGIDPTQAPYSADPTGAEDSSAAFNAALADQVPFISKPSLDVPGGTYTFDHPVILHDNTATNAFAIRGKGKSLTTFQTTATFHANHPGEALINAIGSGIAGGATAVLATGTPQTGTGSGTTKPMKSGWTPEVGYSSARGSRIRMLAGTLVGAGIMTVHIDQSNDPTFGSGVTTTTYTFTEADSGDDVTFAGGSGAEWTAAYFRIRWSLTGTPTSWPFLLQFSSDYVPVTGVVLTGFRINAQGGPTAPNLALGMDDDGRWDTRGILLDRAKYIYMADVWVNKQRGAGIRLREVWDSYFSDLKVIKCASDTEAALSLEPFDPYDTTSNANQNDFFKVHLEDSKGSQLYLGRRSRRNRFYGMKCHGDLASNSVMTLKPHVLLESAFTNQFVACSLNRAGQSHFEFREHPIETAQWADGTLTFLRTKSDRNVVMGCYFDSARTNTALAPGDTASVHIVGGNYNRFIGCTWSSNPKAALIDAGNVDNYFGEDCDLHNFYDSVTGLPTFAGGATVQNEIVGPCRAVWQHPTTGARYRWDGTTLLNLAQPVVVRDFTIQGNAAVSTGKSRAPIHSSAVIASVRVMANTAPTGAALIFDVKKNGTSIYATTPANRPQIAAGATSGTGGTPDTTALAAGDRLTVDVVQVGSTVPGADIVVSVQLQQV